MTDSAASDVLEVHERWCASQVGWNTELMRSSKVKGDRFLHYNLTGQVFRSVDALAAYWDMRRQMVALEASEHLTEPQLMVVGDLAVLSYELAVLHMRSLAGAVTVPFGPSTVAGGDKTTSVYFRGTEIYRKDDGEGRSEWRIWREHYDRVPAEAVPEAVE